MSKLSQYIKYEDGTIRFSEKFDQLQKLKPGVYDIRTDERGMFFVERDEIETDELINLPGSICEDILNHLNNFFDPKTKKKFDKYSLLYKRGMLLYGPPGTGKTSVVNQVIDAAVSQGMTVFIDPYPAFVSNVIQQMRNIENNNKRFMVVWEEFETFLDQEEDLLDLLDGIDQVDNIFFIASTNYIENIPARFKNRPSRFADVVEVGLPTAEVRKIYLENKIHAEDNIDIDMWVEKTEGFTIDHLKDLIVSVLVLDVDFDTAIGKLNGMNYAVEVEEGRGKLLSPIDTLKKQLDISRAEAQLKDWREAEIGVDCAGPATKY